MYGDDILKAELKQAIAECERLRAENTEQPQLTLIQNPARFDWEPVSKIDCYRIGAATIFKAH